MDNRVAVLCHEAKEHLAPRIIKIMKDLVAKFLLFFDANRAYRFRDGFAPLLCDTLDVDLIEWHRVSYSRCRCLFISKLASSPSDFSPICGRDDPLLVCALQTAGENDNSEIGYLNEE